MIPCRQFQSLVAIGRSTVGAAVEFEMESQMRDEVWCARDEGRTFLYSGRVRSGSGGNSVGMGGRSTAPSCTISPLSG